MAEPLDVTTPRSDPLVGRVLGDYQVLDRLAEGGMSVVYKGVRVADLVPVAIKVLKPSVDNDPTLTARMVSEAEAIKAIGDKRIVEVFMHGELPDGRHYLVMEYLEGQALDQWLNVRAHLPWLEATRLLVEVCRPLTAAHQHGVIHRDLKPSNIFLVPQPDGSTLVKLLDFGLAKRVVSGPADLKQTANQQVVGTPTYMAPEQARGLELTPAADLYSLGVVAFELMTGRGPFGGRSPVEVMSAHVNLPPPPLRSQVEVPRGLHELVMQLLEKEPSARPASAEEVRLKLKAVLAEPGPVEGSRTLDPPKKRRKLKRPLSVAFGSLALLGLVGAAFWPRGGWSPGALLMGALPPVPEPTRELPVTVPDAPAPEAPAPEPPAPALAQPEAPPPAEAPARRESPLPTARKTRKPH